MAEIVINLAELDGLARQLRDGPARLARAAAQAMTKAMRRAERRAVWRLSAPGGYRNKVEGRLHARSNRLRGSVSSRTAARISATTTEVVGVLGTAESGSSPIYFFVHEHGTRGPIRPRRAKVLTIPLEAALTPTGLPRFTARGAAQFYDHTFWRTSRRGNLILFGSKKGELTPLFKGEKQVGPIEGTGYLSKSVEEQREPLRDDLEDWFVRSFIRERRAGA